MKYTHIAILVFLLIGLNSMSQIVSENNLFKTFDNIVGLENTGLYNGTEFQDPFLNTDGTFRYFNQFNFAKGNITYDNQFYPDVLLKYDLLDDNVITRSDDNLSLFQIKLIPEKISEFSIYGRDFIRLSNVDDPNYGHGFFEKGFIGNQVSLYIKHIKKKGESALNTGIQYNFKSNNFYILKYNNSYYDADSIKDLMKALPKMEKQIRDFHKRFRTLYNSNRDVFIVNLVKYLDGLMETPNP